MNNRRRTDFAGTEIDCTVAGHPTVIKFDWEHQPDEPDAGLREGYIIEPVFIRLTPRIWRALHEHFGDCIDIRANGKTVPVSVDLNSLSIARGYWQVRNTELEDVLAYWCWEMDAKRLEETMEQLAQAREEAWEALIRHARQDWQERKQAQDAVDALRAARGGRG